MRLKDLREEKKLSQVELAGKLNLSQSTISFYETGDRIPDLSTLIILADFFDVSIDYLSGHSDYRKPLSKEELSVFEADLLLRCRRLTETQKDKILTFVKGMLQEV